MRVHYHTLVANLPRLRTFVITENEPYDPDSEEDLILHLGGTQPTLDRITMTWRYLKLMESDDSPTFVHWLKSAYNPVDDEILAAAFEKRITIDWFPDAACKNRYNWWLGRFIPTKSSLREGAQQESTS
jgi:hypothetical protein